MDYQETSLSKLPHLEWQHIQNCWSHGIDWCVQRIGKKWAVMSGLYVNAPLFKTKTAAYNFITELVLIESRNRYLKGQHPAPSQEVKQ